MKTITFLWSRLHIGCLLILTIIASCSDKTEESPNVQIELTTINLTASDTEEATVTFTANTSWTLTTSDTRAIPAWFTIDRTSGNAGTYTLTIKITEENTSDTDNRIGYIHIIAGTAKSTITIIQPPRNNIVENPENMFDNEDNPDIDGSSEEKAYEIATAEQLLLLSNRVNSKESDKWNNKYYKLTNDIDMSSVCGEEKGSWVPIGRERSGSYIFKGNFNGCGKSIKSLYYNFNQINQADGIGNGGLFGTLGEGGIIKNVVMESPKAYGYLHCGAIVGDITTEFNENKKLTPIISDCTVNNSIIRSDTNAGGIAGRCSGIIINCNISECEIVSNSSGGIVCSLSRGWWDTISMVKNCKVANSKISANHIGGGIAGTSESNIYACIVTDSEIAGQTIVGGIAGTSNSGGRESYLAGCYVDNTILTITNIEQGTLTQPTGGGGGITGSMLNHDLLRKIYSCYVANSVIVSPVSYNAGYIAGEYKGDEDVMSIDACYYSNIDGGNTVNKAIGINYNNASANIYEIEGNQWGDAEKGAIKEMNDRLDKLSNEGHDIGYRYAIGKDSKVPILIKSDK